MHSCSQVWCSRSFVGWVHSFLAAKSFPLWSLESLDAGRAWSGSSHPQTIKAGNPLQMVVPGTSKEEPKESCSHTGPVRTWTRTISTRAAIPTLKRCASPEVLASAPMLPITFSPPSQARETGTLFQLRRSSKMVPWGLWGGRHSDRSKLAVASDIVLAWDTPRAQTRDPPELWPWSSSRVRRRKWKESREFSGTWKTNKCLVAASAVASQLSTTVAASWIDCIAWRIAFELCCSCRCSAGWPKFKALC